ncbi:hypothetical protein RCO28_34370 [Streptomyces sp. LHD-70]|uniref:hypothetical protein n=1 Tax=Streptomyces sp. LHD-70 TaxID=3072140 RepID=UPI0028104CD5|nr:hypothetical protein [Streptomyces sp. LHD-70]MDQ8707518.1 hypothetical protein [Streptomyces sp. LHD-70]
MTLSVPGMLAGAIIALSATLAVRALMPHRVSLAEALRRSHDLGDSSPTTQVAAQGRGPAVWADRIGNRMMETNAFVSRLPARDLALLETTPTALLGRCALYALSGFLIPQWFMFISAVFGQALPLFATLLGGLVCAGVMVFKCLDEERKKARKRRREWQYYVASLLERIALARHSDASAAEALVRAVSPGEGRVEARIRDTVEHARMAGVSVWSSLKTLGDEVGVPELARPAAALALAGEERAAIFDQLSAQAVGVRRALLADRKGQANEATEAMAVPSLVIVFLMAAFMLVPALVRIMTL